MSGQTPMYPIMGGASVPWEVMMPHEHQAYSNHGQTLKRLAERGGLAPCEAWAVINGLRWPSSKPEIEKYTEEWKKYSADINLKYSRLSADLSEAVAALKELLRLYDWRKELGLLESQMRCEAHSDEAAEKMRKDLLKYGREKKAAWEAARPIVARME